MDSTDTDHLQTFEMLDQLGLFSRITTWRDVRTHHVEVRLLLTSSHDNPINFPAHSDESREQAKVNWVRDFKLSQRLPDHIFKLTDYMKAGIITDVIFKEFCDINGNICFKLNYCQPHIGKFSHRDLKIYLLPWVRRVNFYKDILEEVKAQLAHHLEKAVQK